MKVGSLVGLIDNNWPSYFIAAAKLFNTQLPVKDVIYTVREIDYSHPECPEGVITLEEIVNPKVTFASRTDEPGFEARRFAELLPPIAVEEELSKTEELECV